MTVGGSEPTEKQDPFIGETAIASGGPAPATTAGGWTRHVRGAKGLAVNGGALIVNVLASGLTGLAFWVLAARVAPPGVVAEASAAISAVLAVVGLSQQSFVLTLPALLANSPAPRQLTVSVYRAALLMTAIIAPLYVAVGPAVADGLEFLRHDRVGLALVVAALVWCIFSLQDAVLTGMRKATYVLVENTTWGVVRVAILGAMWLLGSEFTVGWLMASWVLPAAVFVAIVSSYLFGSSASPLRQATGSRNLERRRMISYMGAEYLTSVLSSAITLVTGAYALTTLGASAAAPLMIAASLVVVVEGALSSFAQALAVEASRAEGAAERRRGLLRLTAGMLGTMSIGAVAVAAVAGDQIMGLLGPHYTGTGGTALAILMLGVPARALTLVSNADNRIRGDGVRNLSQQIVTCVVCFGLLATGQFTTVASIAWVLVGMRYATAALAAAHLSKGRLHLA